MQKTAYELRISDCSSDVCSADLLDRGRSFGAAIHKFGALIGRTINWIEQNIFGGKAPWSIRDLKKDHETLKLAKDSEKIIYPKPDGKLSFDKLSSVFVRSEEHTSELQSLMRISYAVFCLKKKKNCNTHILNSENQ